MARHTWRCVLVLVALIAITPISGQAKRHLVLTGGMLIDGYDAPPQHNMAILIEGDRITAVARAADLQIPKDATVIDTSGMTMLPGLIDAHVHLMILGHGSYTRWDPWIAEHGIARVMEISAKQLLMAGVTTAVDLASPLKESLSVRDRINAGVIPGSRMLVSGPWLAEQIGSNPLAEIKVTTVEDAVKATEDLIKSGVDRIKVYPLRLELYKAVVDVAHKHKLKVHAHVYRPDNVRDALNAGVDILEHVGSAGNPPYDADLVRAVAEKGRPIIPTAAHRIAIFPATIDFPERMQDSRLKEDFPPDVYQEVQDSFKNWRSISYFSSIDRQIAYSKQAMKQWLDAGAVIGMGTDSGSPLNFHTEALWRELKFWVDNGMTPQRAITAATRINAQIEGIGRDVGTIEGGKLADIIVVKGNPLFDVVALSDPAIVVKQGVVYKGPGAQGRRQTAVIKH